MTYGVLRETQFRGRRGEAQMVDRDRKRVKIGKEPASGGRRRARAEFPGYLSLVLVDGKSRQNRPEPFRMTGSCGRISNGVKAGSVRN